MLSFMSSLSTFQLVVFTRKTTYLPDALMQEQNVDKELIKLNIAPHSKLTSKSNSKDYHHGCQQQCRREPN